MKFIKLFIGFVILSFILGMGAAFRATDDIKGVKPEEKIVENSKK